jgi:hypothetical protein
MTDSIKLRIAVVSFICVFALGWHFIGKQLALPPGAGNPAQAIVSAPAPAPAFERHLTEIHYPACISSGDGTNMAATKNKNWLSTIRIAVPDTTGHIHYLPGSDPQAVAYLAEKAAARQHLIVDNGPSGVDTSQLPPGNAFASQSNRVGIMGAGCPQTPPYYGPTMGNTIPLPPGNRFTGQSKTNGAKGKSN